ncbi:MAG TPA: FGGY family carbohydrate kinase [Solirubrobacteraceae bacterium]|jgi:glycerol kinase|nr:FGGY family carbohydrate kinase [Solirubrobacteraceae bacterium]
MSGTALLGIDEGTTAVKVAAFDAELRPLGSARRAIALEIPAPGLAQQDPEAILAVVEDAVAEVLEGLAGRELIGAGLAHQGESVLAWEAHSGRALTPLITWQDKRHSELLAQISSSVVGRSGLPLDPYFSAGKLAWLLAHDERVQSAAREGSLRMGTVDAFLCARLGGRFATDLSTASRTQLLALGGREWDAELLSAFTLREEWLPALGPTCGDLGELRSSRWREGIALRAQLVDQQAALAGSGAVAPGELKATYGTGVFVLGRTDGPAQARDLLQTVAWATAAADGSIGEIAYALDGGVFSAGALLDWLASLGLARDGETLTALAGEVADSAGVQVLPALAGLGAPHWRPQARAVIAGLHGGVRSAHVARAALEAIAWRVCEIVEAIAEAVPVQLLRVDGGLSNDATLVRIQADAAGVPLALGQPDATALGAAMLAGVGAGLFADVADAAARLPPPRVIEPGSSERERAEGRARWRAFAHAAAQL